MKKTLHYTGHRWTTEELRLLMQMWASRESVSDIATKLEVTTASVLKMVGKLRSNGVPLERRTKGHVAGRSNKSWTQGEVEYLIRRREEKATCEEIGIELGRTWNAVNAMIGNLRKEHVPVAMRGHGVRRLWNVDSLKAVAIQSGDCKIIEMNQRVA